MELNPDSPLYHNINSLHLKARFSADALEQAVKYAVKRHPALRTSFDVMSYSEPVQLVDETATLPIEVDDLRGLSSAAQDEIIDSFIDNEKNRPFDLMVPPLLRFHIHLRSEESFQFTLAECHAISDGWSLHATLSEIFTRYFALLNNEPLKEEPPPRSLFSDFVHLEREAVGNPDSRSFWQREPRPHSPPDGRGCRARGGSHQRQRFRPPRSWSEGDESAHVAVRADQDRADGRARQSVEPRQPSAGCNHGHNLARKARGHRRRRGARTVLEHAALPPARRRAVVARSGSARSRPSRS